MAALASEDWCDAIHGGTLTPRALLPADLRVTASDERQTRLSLRMLNLSVRVDGQEVQAACPQALWFTDLYRATLLTGTYKRRWAGGAKAAGAQH